MPIRGIVLDDVRISARRRLATVDAEDIALRNVSIMPTPGPVRAVRDSRNVSIEGGAISEETNVFLHVDGRSSEGIRVSVVDTRNAKTLVETGPGVRAGAIVNR